MDKKTVEYMESRIKAYRNLQYEVECLEKCKVELLEHSGLRIGTRDDYYHIKGDSATYLKTIIVNEITTRLAEIEKEMEEI